MNEVAAAAGVARATLYRYFPTREQLLQALTAAAISATAARLAAEHQAGVEKAAALITTAFLHGIANRQDSSEQDQAARRRPGTGPDQHSSTEDGRSRNPTGARRPRTPARPRSTHQATWADPRDVPPVL